jgi:CrcB protein
LKGRWHGRAPIIRGCRHNLLLVAAGGAIDAGLRHLANFLGGLRLSLDFATLWERGATLPAFGYALASVIGAIIAVFLGLWLARSPP